MRKTIVTGLTAATFAATSSMALAGGVAAPELEPEVFVPVEEAAAMGSLGGAVPLLLAAVVLGAVALGSDDDTEEEGS